MIDVVLYQPEIPGNTGNIIRLCANTGARLHLVRPLGFDLDDSKLRRAGLDYHEWADLRVHDSWAAAQAALPDRRWLACTTRGSASAFTHQFRDGDALLFGPETRGLPIDLIEALPLSQRLRLPMRPDSRSLNLSNCVAVMVYEAWRQAGFDGGR